MLRLPTLGTPAPFATSHAASATLSHCCNWPAGSRKKGGKQSFKGQARNSCGSPYNDANDACQPIFFKGTRLDNSSAAHVIPNDMCHNRLSTTCMHDLISTASKDLLSPPATIDASGPVSDIQFTMPIARSDL